MQARERNGRGEWSQAPTRCDWGFLSYNIQLSCMARYLTLRNHVIRNSQHLFPLLSCSGHALFRFLSFTLYLD